jgi:[ribosomal protein S18]-alanine N-acetyltransferase
MTLTLRYMTQYDVPVVAATDKMVFDMPWAASSYSYEVNSSPYSYMSVLDAAERAEPKGWKRLLPNFGDDAQSCIVAYGGMWCIQSEAHISTIATHPDWQRRGFGEVVFASMIQRAINLAAEYIVLEVRAGNASAQQLYLKYGFTVAGVKKGYYKNTGEDAYDMRLDLAREGVLTNFRTLYQVITTRHDFVDKYSNTPRPKHRNLDLF